jgi:hypothetical protein
VTLRLLVLLLALGLVPACGDDDYAPPDSAGSSDLGVPDLAGPADLAEDPGDAADTD